MKSGFSGLNYPPWVGSHYGEKGNIRLMVVGRSYYDARYRDRTLNSYMNDLIKGRAEDSFFTGLELVLSEGRHWKSGRGTKMSLDRKRFWNGLCFHQFIQGLLSDGFTPPERSMWKEGQEIFKQVLFALQPEIVVMAGDEVFDHMPTLGGHPGKSYDRGGRERMKSWILEVGGGECRIASLLYPRDSAFDPQEWKHLYQAFLSDYKNDFGLTGFSMS